MLSNLLRASVAALMAIATLLSSARAQCDGCQASASPAFVDSGVVTSCAGIIQLRMTITPSPGECVLDGDHCIQIEACDFFVFVDYKARSCTGNKATFGKTGCGTVF